MVAHPRIENCSNNSFLAETIQKKKHVRVGVLACGGMRGFEVATLSYEHAILWNK